jgi:hypothetical protein
MVDQPPIRDVSLGDLGELSLRGNVALAVRCARRLRPCLERLPANYPDRQAALKSIDEGIAVAEAFAADQAQDSVRAAAVSFDVLQVAQGAEKFGQYAPYAVSHAIKAAAEALRIGVRANDTDAMEIVACAYGSIRVTLNGGTGYRLPENVANSVRGAVRADFEALRGLRLGGVHEPGSPVDATDAGPLGPLWPDGAPAGY